MYVFIYFIILSITGTLLHFTYELSNENKVVAIFSSVNESVWEHIKLLLTPIFFVSTIINIINKPNGYFVCLFIQLLLAILLIIIFYYLKNLFFKNTKDYLYILSFFITSLIISFVSNYLYKMNFSLSVNWYSLIGTLIIFIMYLSFTLFPPKLDIFKDPVTGKYGIK